MSEQDIPMSKSKRKRLRKKNSKASKSSSNESVASNDESVDSEQQLAAVPPPAPPSTGTLLTPQEVLRQSLLAKGYSANDIDRATEEMWDKGLAYDELDAVLKYLEKSDDDEGRHPVEREGAVSATEKKQDEDDDKDQRTTQTAETEDATAEMSSGSAVPAPLQKPAAARTSMAAKLDMVAQAENLTDAIFALTQWINKAAKPDEVRFNIESNVRWWIACHLTTKILFSSSSSLTTYAWQKRQQLFLL
jgi:3-polyprenyl-4-hydroxybenzoate decarboxylase